MDYGLNIKMRFCTEDQPVVEPLSTFMLSFVQALLKTGYYQSDHPGSTAAKLGLYQEWIRLNQKEREISVILQNTGKEEEVMISGVLSEVVPLKLLFLPSVAEIFIPKVRQYFNRRHLMSFTLKPGITREEFEGFVDIMTDIPGSLVDSEVMAETTQKLLDLQIVHVSVVYMEDVPLFERPMHWMARVVLARLGKDLRMVPLYKHLTLEQICILKTQVCREILRPITNGTILKDVFVNCDVLQPSEKGEPPSAPLIEEELYQGLTQNQSVGLLVELARALKDGVRDAKNSPTSAYDTRLVSVIHRILRDLPEGIENRLTDELIETLLAKGIHLDDLPRAWVTEILNKQKTENYLKQKARYWEVIKKGWPRDAQPFFSILSVLLARDDFYAFGELLEKLHDAFVKTFGSDDGFLQGSGIASLGETIISKLQARRMAKRKEMLSAMEPFAGALAPYLFPLCAYEDLWLRRNICRILAGVGASVLPGLIFFAQAERRHWTVIRNIVMIVGDIGIANDEVLHFLKRCQQHPHIRVREEVMSSYGKINGPTAEAALLQVLDDSDPTLCSRAVLALAHCHSVHERYLAYLRQALRKKDKHEKETEGVVQIACCLALESLILFHPDLVPSFEPMLRAAIASEKSLFGLIKKDQEKEDDVKKAILRLLNSMGIRRAVPALTACRNGTVTEKEKTL